MTKTGSIRGQHQAGSIRSALLAAMKRKATDKNPGVKDDAAPRGLQPLEPLQPLQLGRGSDPR